MKLKDAVVLILGGTGNIGTAISTAFTKEGAIVCAHGLDIGDYQADLQNDTEAQTLHAKVTADHGPVDILINAISAPLKPGSFETKTWDDFANQLNVQLKTGVVLANLILPSMKVKQNGQIINILSAAVTDTPPSNLADYVTSKYAMLGLTMALSKELERFNVKVNAVSPRYVQNAFSAPLPEKMAELEVRLNPLGRLTTPEDVATTVIDLAKGQATGQNVVI